MPPFDQDYHVGRRSDRLRGERERNQCCESRGNPDLLFTLNTADILQVAERLKQEGNNHFRSKAWEEALAQYKSALGHLPKRKAEPPREPDEPSESSEPEAAEISTPEALPATPPQPINEEAPEIVKARAVLNANVGACYVQLVGGLFYASPFVFTVHLSQGEHKRVVEACTEGRVPSLLVQPRGP